MKDVLLSVWWWIRKVAFYGLGIKDGFLRRLNKRFPGRCSDKSWGIRLYFSSRGDIERAANRDSSTVLRGLINGLYSQESVEKWKNLPWVRMCDDVSTAYYEFVVALKEFWPEKLEQIALAKPEVFPSTYISFLSNDTAAIVNFYEEERVKARRKASYEQLLLATIPVLVCTKPFGQMLDIEGRILASAMNGDFDWLEVYVPEPPIPEKYKKIMIPRSMILAIAFKE